MTDSKLVEEIKELENNISWWMENAKTWKLKYLNDIVRNKDTFGYAIKLDYTEETKSFIKCFRLLGKIQGFRIRVRGGGSISPKFRKDGLNLRHMDRGLPLKYAETVRLYVDFK